MNMPISMPPDEPAQQAEPMRHDSRRIMRIGLLVLGLGLGGFLLWAAFAPLDEGVPTQGMVSIDTKRKTVQHADGGIVREIKVREGAHVEAGQILMTLDTAIARADYEAARQRYYALRAMEDRLVTEQNGLDRIAFHPDLTRAKADPTVHQHIVTQERLFHSRRAALSTGLASIEAAIGGLNAQLRGSAEMLTQRKRQLRLLNDELKGIRDLVAEGYAPYNRQLELERNLAEINVAIAELESNTERAKKSIEELQQRAELQRREARKEVDGLLAEVRREVGADAERLTAAGQELARTEVKAPVSGQVIGLAVQTVGAVLQPAQKLMDIVPEKEALLLETRIAPHLADRIHPGLLADVRFNAFSHAPQLVVEGRLLTVSRDLLTEPETQQSYYLARVEITPAGMKMLAGREIQPGMPAEVIIKTGERSLLTYLLYPLVRRLAQSMKEE